MKDSRSKIIAFAVAFLTGVYLIFLYNAITN